jgi:membrane protease YdiL (CAAX protease family)
MGGSYKIIRHDRISKLLLAVAAGATIWLATFQTTALILFPAILMVVGLGMEYRLEKRREEDDTASSKDLRVVGYYAAIGLCGILITSWAVSYVQIPSQLLSIKTLSGINIDALLYSILMAVSEEQFFRGFITDGLLSQKIPMVSSNPYYALVLSAAIFMAYHWARYGTDLNALIYVFFGGFILSWIAYKSRRLSPSMISHVCANVIAVVGGV